VYDRVGNRTNRTDSLAAANSEQYTYDGVNQIKSLNRTGFSETWNYDLTGNWLQYNRAGVVENRTHNAANEVLTNSTHDRNGNMTVMPGLRGVYDAWNRLVEARNASNVLIARYDYNGLNQRVRKTIGSVATTSFFNRAWQELETATPGHTTTVYIWGLRYIDDLVLRDRGHERLYSLADPNWNVVATTNNAGAVQERMRYDAFGRVTWLTPTFGARNNSDFAWNRLFTGQIFDSETGLVLCRMRYLHTGLGRWINRDPIEYLAGDVNLYRYVLNQALRLLDPFGLQDMCPPLTADDIRRKIFPGTSPFPSIVNNSKWGKDPFGALGDKLHGFVTPTPGRQQEPPRPSTTTIWQQQNGGFFGIGTPFHNMGNLFNKSSWQGPFNRSSWQGNTSIEAGG